MIRTPRRPAAPRVVLAWIAASQGLLGCTTPQPAGDPVGCTIGFFGTDSGPPALEIVAVQPDDTVAAVQDGGMVPLMEPPQGGRVLFAGARAINVDGCGVQLTGALRDLTTGQVTVDSRTVNLVAAGGGWGSTGVGAVSSAISNFANIAVCPNQSFSTNAYGVPLGLEVNLVDREGRTAASRLVVIPYCAEPATAATCMCTCAKGYMLGQACPAGDAG